MDQLSKFKLLSGCKDDDLAKLLLEQAEQTLLNETRRTILIPALFSCQIDLAVIMYNRLGTEGEMARSEGGINVSFMDMPTIIQDIISINRLARVGGHAYEKKPAEDIPLQQSNT